LRVGEGRKGHLGMEGSVYIEGEVGARGEEKSVE